MYGAPRSMLMAANAMASDFDVEIITYGHGDLVSAAQELGIQITVINESSLKWENRGNRLFHFFQKIINGIWQNLNFLYNLWILMKKRPDLVYVNTIAKEQPIRMAILLGLKVLVHVREGANYIFPSNTNRNRQISYIFDNVSNFICVSEAIKKQILVRLGDKEVAVSVVYNGIDCNDFTSRQYAKYDFPNPNGKKIIGFVGNLSARKGVNIFIAAAKELVSMRGDILFLVAGGEKDVFIDYVRRAGAENLIDRYIFHEEFIGLPQSIFEKLDIFCMTSLIEPFGRVNLEAACFKKAIIASNVDGVPEFVIDGITGLLIPPNNVDALVQAISKLLDNEAMRIELGRNAYNLVQSNFTIDEYAKGIKNHIRTIINN